MNKKWFSFFTTVTLLLAVALSSGQMAVAHAELEGAAPAPGSTITQSPKQLRLIFSEGIELMGTRVSLLDANNNAVVLDEPQLDSSDADNRTLVVGVPASLTAGGYTVQWKNLSVDGHSEKGSYAFTLNLDAPTRAATSAPTTAPTRAPTATRNSIREVTLKFALKAGQTDVACNTAVTGLGATKRTAQIADARLYLSNIKLLTREGKAVPLQLTVDRQWQSAAVALLDFENATGLCKAAGTPETRTVVVGKVPAGIYTGITFDLGVPAALNHADAAFAKAPLTVRNLWLNRQMGYTFARVDLSVSAPATQTAASTFSIRVNSTGCGEATSTKATAVAVAPVKPCTNPNIAQVRLTPFDPDKDTLVADLAALLADVNLAQSKPATCGSSVNDANCAKVFANLGLSLATGQCLNGCASATFFRVETIKP